MGKLLRVLVIILFLLSGAALTLGIMLFARRELLKGRTQNLERHVIALAEAFIEDAPPAHEEGVFTPRDIDNVGPTVIANPETSTFWDTYNYQLERQDLAKMRLNTPDRIRTLMTYYVRSTFETYMLSSHYKIIKDEITGVPRTRVEPGENYRPTMRNLLDEVMEKAGAQYALLNDTRQQLTLLREELVRTIEELNQRKRDLRASLAKIVELENTIRQLRSEIARLEARVRELEEEVRAKQEQIEEQERRIQELEEQAIDLNATINQLKEELKRREDIDGRPRVEDPSATMRLEPGPKGKVVSVNQEWNYVVMEFSEEALAELIGIRIPEGGQFPPPAEYLVKRPDREEFVTKVRLFQVKRARRLAIANILTDWQQIPVQVGDVVAF